MRLGARTPAAVCALVLALSVGLAEARDVVRVRRERNEPAHAAAARATLRPRQTSNSPPDATVTSDVVVTVTPPAQPPVIVSSTSTSMPSDSSTSTTSSATSSTSSATSTSSSVSSSSSSATSSPTSSPSSGLKSGTIGGISAAAAVGVFAIAIAVWLTYRRLNRRGNTDPASGFIFSRSRRHDRDSSGYDVGAATTNFYDPTIGGGSAPRSTVGSRNTGEYLGAQMLPERPKPANFDFGFESNSEGSRSTVGPPTQTTDYVPVPMHSPPPGKESFAVPPRRVSPVNTPYDPDEPRAHPGKQTRWGVGTSHF